MTFYCLVVDESLVDESIVDEISNIVPPSFLCSFFAVF